MLEQDKHRLLKRQLKKSKFNFSDYQEYSKFLEQVNNAYIGFDQDIVRIENILEESSKELFKANQVLVSENYSAKTQLNSIVNTIQGVLFQTDLRGNFKYLNKAWEELTGLTLKESLNKSYKTLLFGKNKKERLKLKLFLARKNDEYKTVFKYYTPSKEKKWIELNLSITLDENGNPDGTIGTMTDVTNLKETEIELNLANKSKDKFLSTMSHEIRTPLNAVIGLSDILLMDEYLPEQLENLEALKYSGEHLLGLINDILDINKIQSGKIKFEESEFSLDYLMKTVQSDFKILGQDKYLVFRIVKDKNIPDYLIGDSLKLAQVLKNLLSNAFKFTDRGVIQLSIKTKKINKNKISLSFEVKDTGIGISLDKQKSIFKSFTQAESNTTRLYGGTGLGLTISKNLLKIQKSKLQVVSKPNIGSIFSFKLNFKISDTNKNNRSVVKSEIASTAPINLKVLVAEDNKLNELVLKKLFEKWNIDFLIKENGEELLKVYEKEDFDLILMDLQMPVLDGYETTKIIRDLPDSVKSSIPIIALTAFAQTDIKEKTTKHKMNGYMSKPFNANEFHKLLRFYSNKIIQKVS